MIFIYNALVPTFYVLAFLSYNTSHMLPQGAVLYGGLMCLQMETVSCLTLNSLLKNHGLEDITFLYNLPLIILTMVVQNRQNPFKVEYFFF